MTLKHLTVLTLLVVSVLCSVQTNESDDIKSIIEDIYIRLDDKETRISQLEKIVRLQETTIREQQGQITALEEDVAIQNQMIRDLQQKPGVKSQTDGVAINKIKESSNKGKQDDFDSDAIKFKHVFKVYSYNPLSKLLLFCFVFRTKCISLYTFKPTSKTYIKEK